eukprot:GHVT01085804.1.p1 GENE.GHVT01085804.1~~GHVT01085804.1.p1  ORF type:complete len:609 (+),score=60.19 GHVT01085804.1:864-2690(+)
MQQAQLSQETAAGKPAPPKGHISKGRLHPPPKYGKGCLSKLQLSLDALPELGCDATVIPRQRELREKPSPQSALARKPMDPTSPHDDWVPVDWRYYNAPQRNRLASTSAVTKVQSTSRGKDLPRQPASVGRGERILNRSNGRKASRDSLALPDVVIEALTIGAPNLQSAIGAYPSETFDSLGDSGKSQMPAAADAAEERKPFERVSSACAPSTCSTPQFQLPPESAAYASNKEATRRQKCAPSRGVATPSRLISGSIDPSRSSASSFSAQRLPAFPSRNLDTAAPAPPSCSGCYRTSGKVLLTELSSVAPHRPERTGWSRSTQWAEPSALTGLSSLRSISPPAHLGLVTLQLSAIGTAAPGDQGERPAYVPSVFGAMPLCPPLRRMRSASPVRFVSTAGFLPRYPTSHPLGFTSQIDRDQLPARALRPDEQRGVDRKLLRVPRGAGLPPRFGRRRSGRKIGISPLRRGKATWRLTGRPHRNARPIHTEISSVRNSIKRKRNRPASRWKRLYKLAPSSINTFKTSPPNSQPLTSARRSHKWPQALPSVAKSSRAVAAAAWELKQFPGASNEVGDRLDWRVQESKVFSRAKPRPPTRNTREKNTSFLFDS